MKKVKKVFAFFLVVAMIMGLFSGTGIETKAETNKTVTVYYSTSWEQAYIHYKTENGSWTMVPGKKMEKSSEQNGYQWKAVISLGNNSNTQVCFNNGSGNWDSCNGANYTVHAGSYGVKDGKVNLVESNVIITPIATTNPTQVPTVAVTETPTTTPTANKEVVIYYNNSYLDAYMHYKTGNGAWTTVPGVKMEQATDMPGYRWKYKVSLGEAVNTTVCFNNGSGSWDSRNGKNYTMEAGVWGIKNQQLTKLSIGVFPTETPTATPTVAPTATSTVAPTETPIATPTMTPTGDKTATVFYYNSDFKNAYIHYMGVNGEWTTAPGVRMEASSEQKGYSWKYVIPLGTNTSTKVCFNNGNGTWDSKNGSNYTVEAGVWGIKNQQSAKLTSEVTVTPMLTITPGVTLTPIPTDKKK